MKAWQEAVELRIISSSSSPLAFLRGGGLVSGDIFFCVHSIIHESEVFFSVANDSDSDEGQFSLPDNVREFLQKRDAFGISGGFFFQRCTSFVVLTATRQNIRIEMYGGVAPSDFSCVEAGGSINSSLPKYSRFTKSFQAFFPHLLRWKPRGKIKQPLFVW